MNDEKKQAVAEAERIAREIAGRLGVEIVEFVFRSQGRHSLLRIDIDRPGLPGVTIDDCERLSRTLGDRIEELPFLGTPYELQVSSPGIDRPIRTDDDHRRNAGRPVRLEFRDDGGKMNELHGRLAPPGEPGWVTIEHVDGTSRIARDRIAIMKQDDLLGARGRKVR